MKYATIVLFILMIFTQTESSLAQSDESHFKKGDNVSSLCFDSTSQNSICLSQFGGKKIILFSWSILCGDFPALFKKVDSLQSVFDEQIQFIMANREGLSETQDFFLQRPGLKKPLVPMICGDKALFRLFPDVGYAPSVFISKSGVVEYLINDYNISQSLLEDYLSERSLSEKEPTDYARLKSGIFHTELSGCHPATDFDYNEGKLSADGQQLLIGFGCQSILELIKIAFEENNNFDFGKPSLIDLQISDSAYFFRPRNMLLYDDWLKNNAFTYQLHIPVAFEKNKYAFMQQDMLRFFSLSIQIEMREVEVLVMRSVGINKAVCSKGGSPDDQMLVWTASDPVMPGVPLMRNQPFRKFVQRLHFYINKYSPFYFLNKMNLDCNIDIKFSRKTFENGLHLDFLKQDLLKYGISLQEEKQILPVLVIKKNEKSGQF